MIARTTLPLSAIRTVGGTQPRAGISDELVREYADLMREGTLFPPIVDFYDGTDHWLADGFHRVHAARLAECAEPAADMRQGTRRDAVLHSVGANATHGLRRTTADKRRAVVTLLQDEEWGKWSNSEIARRCAVHHEMVGIIRDDLLFGGIRQMDGTHCCQECGISLADRDCIVIGRGPEERIYCRPCGKEVWGALVRLVYGEAFVSARRVRRETGYWRTRYKAGTPREEEERLRPQEAWEQAGEATPSHQPVQRLSRRRPRWWPRWLP